MAGRRKNKRGGGNAHDRAVAKDKGIVPIKIQNSEAPDQRSKILNYVVLRLGGIFGVFAFGVGLILGSRFWWGTGIVYVSLGLLLWDLCYEFRRVGSKKLAAGAVIYLALIILCSYMWIFTSAPLQVTANSRVVAYGPGSKIEGIDWKDRYAELELHIQNMGSEDDDDFEAQVSTNLIISRLKLRDGLANCNIAPLHPPEPTRTQLTGADGKPIGPANVTPGQEYFALPQDKDGNILGPESDGSDRVYLIRCDKIPAKTSLTFFGAVEFLQIKNARENIAPFGPPRPIDWVSVKATFKTNGRKRVRDVTTCDAGKSCTEG
jgi:hypothetical protein